MRTLFLVSAMALLGLAACDDGTQPPPPSKGAEAKAAMNDASLRYGECVDKGSKTVPVAEKTSSEIADEAFAGCKDDRQTLLDAVLHFRRIGYPSEPQATSQAVAEQSVTELEDSIRERALLTATTRRLGNGKVR